MRRRDVRHLLARPYATRHTPKKRYTDARKLLNLPPHASPHDAKRAFREMALAHHPDVATHPDTEAFARIVDAYETLSDPLRRAAWEEANRPRGGLDLGAGASVLRSERGADRDGLFGEGRARSKKARDVSRSDAAAAQREAMERARQRRR